MMNNIFFVSGIDTDIGKTIATGWLAQEMAKTGQTVITQKLIQTGTPVGEIAADILEHRRLQGIPLTKEDHAGLTAPVVYSYPCSPHLAAEMEHRPPDFAAIEQATEILATRYDFLLIEGAGGLCVPLTRTWTTLDYVKKQGFPLILVSCGRLGSINHTLLSLKVCQAEGIRIARLIYNEYGIEDKNIAADSRQYLRDYLTKAHPEAIFQVLPDLSGS